MSLYATLGETELEVVSWMDGLDIRYGSSFSEHALIGRKPAMQHTGWSPDELSFSVTLHSSWCNPADEVRGLKDHMDAATPLDFVLGNGEYRGVFVIVDLSVTYRQTNGTGTVISLEASLRLREYVGDPAKPNPPGVFSRGMYVPPVTASTDVLSTVSGQDAAPAPEAAKAVSQAVSSASEVSQAAGRTASMAATLLSEGESALQAARELSDDLRAIASRLPIAAFSAISSLPGASDVMAAYNSAKRDLGFASDAMRTVEGGVSAARSARKAAESLARVRPALSGIAAKVAIRGIQL